MIKHKYDIEKHPKVKAYLEKHLQKPYGQNHLNYGLILQLVIELTRKDITNSYHGIVRRHDNIGAVRALDVLFHSHLLEGGVNQHSCKLNDKGKDLAEKLEEMLNRE